MKIRSIRCKVKGEEETNSRISFLFLSLKIKVCYNNTKVDYEKYIWRNASTIRTIFFRFG